MAVAQMCGEMCAGELCGGTVWGGAVGGLLPSSIGLCGGALWRSCVGGMFVEVVCVGALWGGGAVCIGSCISFISCILTGSFTEVLNILLCDMFQSMCCRGSTCGSVKPGTLSVISCAPHPPPPQEVQCVHMPCVLYSFVPITI